MTFSFMDILSIILKGKAFKSREALIEAIIEVVQKIDKKVWISVYDEWIRRLQEVIERKGEYIH